MSTFRSTIMLYSSIFAFNLAVPSIGFGKLETSDHKNEIIDNENKLKEKDITSTGVSTSNKEQKSLSIEGAPPSENEVKLIEENEKKINEIKQKKIAFTKKIKDIIKKYKTSLAFVLGQDVKIEDKINAINKKITEGLTVSSVKDQKRFDEIEAFSKNLEHKLDQKYKFILSEKESIADEMPWFEEVNKYAVSQLKKLQELRNEMKADPRKLEASADIYLGRIQKFLSAHTVFSITSIYLKNGKEFCHNKIISGHFIKALFPHFTSSLFQGADNIQTGERAPMTIIGEYALYPIDIKEYENTKFMSELTPDSEDALIINAANELSKKNSDGHTKNAGPITLSSKIKYYDGMKCPVCIYTLYSTDKLMRFSLEDATEEQKNTIKKHTNNQTIQLLDYENREENEKIALLDKELQALIAAKKNALTKKMKDTITKDEKITKDKDHKQDDHEKDKTHNESHKSDLMHETIAAGNIEHKELKTHEASHTSDETQKIKIVDKDQSKDKQKKDLVEEKKTEEKETKHEENDDGEENKGFISTITNFFSPKIDTDEKDEKKQ